MNLPFWRRGRREQELDDEVRAHLAMATRDRIERGEPPEDAAREARREFGNVALVKDTTRDTWAWASLERFGADVHFGLRLLRRDPAFAAVAVLSLALGIGANSAMFTVVDSVLLRPLPYRSPDRLVMVYSVLSFGWMSTDEGSLAEADYPTLEGLNVFDAVAASTTFPAFLSDAGDPVRLSRSAVTTSLFPLLGVVPALGSGFRSGEPVGAREAVISNEIWRARYHADPHAIGRHILLDGVPYTIVGIMPPEFGFPERTEVWTPLTIRPDYRANATLRLVARLATGVTAEQAAAAVSGALGADRSGDEVRYRVVDLRETIVGKSRFLILVLFAAVGCVALIAATTFATLLTVRTATRRHELSIRASLGASRARLLSQLVTESVALAVLGGGAGLLLAHLSLPVALSWLPPDTLPRTHEIHLSGGVLGFTFIVCLLMGAVFGAAPAVAGSRTGVVTPPDRRTTAAPTDVRLRGALVVLETALVLVLLIGAGLLAKSLWTLERVDPGFRPDGVVVAELFPPDRLYSEPSSKRALYQHVLGGLRATPLGEGAAAVTLLPFGSVSWAGDFAVEGRDASSLSLAVGKPAVSPGYFTAMGIPLLQGRPFDARDRQGAPLVAIVSESVARAGWPGQDPLGGRLTMDSPTGSEWLEVVGVVGDVRQSSLGAQPLPMIYVPLAQEWRSFFLASAAIVLPHAPDVGAAATAVRAQVRAVDPQLPVGRIAPLDSLLSASLLQPRFRMQLLMAFAGLALILTVTGTYGVMAYDVGRRTAEFAVRRALGASTQRVVWLAAGRTLRLVSIGLGVGLAAAGFASHVLQSFLFGVQPLDSATFVVGAASLLIVAALASTGPALRAARVDPAVTLRMDV